MAFWAGSRAQPLLPTNKFLAFFVERALGPVPDNVTKKLGTKPRPYRTALIDFSFCLSYLVSLIFILNFSGVLFKTGYNDTSATGRITADTHETPRSNDWSQNNNG